MHRKKYRDWSLPKGKTDNGETVPVAAVREVWEESGAQIRLGIPLDRKVYDLDKSTRKYVSWWAGDPDGGDPSGPGLRGRRGGLAADQGGD